ncbi:MAG: iron uptake porin [Snowella sp.]|nr:iron uptake porin [Snowella sp.]
MSKSLLSSLPVTALLLSLAIIPSQATPDPNGKLMRSPKDPLHRTLDGFLNPPHNRNTEDGLSQVTNVSELRDIAPSDWAYEALRSLVERYGCIVGYPDRTFRGNRALSRWEFAAGLNACLNTMERLLQENVAVIREDLDKLKRLTEEFRQELTAMGVRVDNLEARTAFLENHTFSTTTKLEGEVVLGLAGIAAGERNGGEPNDKSTVLGYRTRLQLLTSFTGEDELYIRLATGNIPTFEEETGTFQSTLGFAQPDDNQLAVEVIKYNFPLTSNINMIFGTGEAFDDFASTLNFLDGDGAYGSFTAFGTRNPIYYDGEGTGLGFQGNLGDFQWSLAYLAMEAHDPNLGKGLFNGPYGALAQIGYNPSENFGIAFTYVHGYDNLDTATGSLKSNFQYFTETTFDQPVKTANNAYGLEFSWKVTDGFVLGGWGGYTKSLTLNPVAMSEEEVLPRGSLDIWNWAVTLGFPDAFKEGNLAGIIVGMQPWVTSSTVNLPDGFSASDRDTSMHFEAFYQYAVNKNIFITPGIAVITSPDNDSRNAPLVIGTIRTTFAF